MKKTVYKKLLKQIFLTLIILSLFFGIIIGTINGINSYQELEKGAFDDAVLEIVIGIIVAFFSLILIILQPIIQILIIALQNVIYILAIYPLLQNIFGFGYEKFLIISSSIFLILLLIFSVLKLFKTVNEYENKFNWMNLVKAILFLITSPILMMFILSLCQVIALKIFGISNIYEFSIYDLIYNISLGNNSIEWGTSNYADFSEKFFKLALFLVAGCFTIWFLFWFSLSLGTRIFELIIMGFLGIVVSTSSYVYDEGQRFRLWNSIMIQKILIPIILLIGYVIFLIFLPIIISLVGNIPSNFFALGLEWESKALIELSLLIGGGIVIKSLSTEWAFMIVGESGGGVFATQMNTIMGEMGAGVPTTFARKMINMPVSLSSKLKKVIGDQISEPKENSKNNTTSQFQQYPSNISLSGEFKKVSQNKFSNFENKINPKNNLNLENQKFSKNEIKSKIDKENHE